MNGARRAQIRRGSMVAIVIVGSATIDEQLVHGREPRLQLGGVVTYAGAALARLGFAPWAVCNLGGPWGSAARARLEQFGIAVEAGATAVMTSFRNTVFADGEREQYLASMALPIEHSLVTRGLRGIDEPHVHLGPLHGSDIDRAALQMLVEHASYVTLDVQDLYVLLRWVWFGPKYRRSWRPT
jgi:hypothetical protein